MWGPIIPDNDEIERCLSAQLLYGRIIRENRGQYLIARGDETIRAEIAGAFRYTGPRPVPTIPAVGDWAAF